MAKIKVLVKKPDCAPEVQEIENDWREFKRLIGDVVFFGNDGGEEEQSLTDDQIEYLQYMLHFNHVAMLRSECDLQFVLTNKRQRG